MPPSEQPAEAPFQVCGACRSAWPTWEAFVLDPGVRLHGFQPVATDPDINLLIFEHRCGSSISVLTQRLRHLLPQPQPDQPHIRLMGSDECRRHCRKLTDLEACDAPCSNARDRDLIRLVQQMKRRGATG